MKTKKLFLSIFLTGFTIASWSFALISCSNPTPEPEPDKPWTDETPYDYIYNRTFSIEKIAGSDIVNVVWGTGWIIDDSTPSINNDYCYYIATNWHVTHGFDIIGKEDEFYGYGDNSLASTSGWVEHNDYKKFKSFKPLTNSNYLYNDEEQTEYFKKGIDLFVCNVNFGNPTGEIKTKLDKLNSLRQEKGQINKFVNSDDKQILAKKKITGGYPEYDNGGSGTEFQGGGKWEYHDDITSNNLEFVTRKGYGFQYQEGGQLQLGHPIGQPDRNQQGFFVRGGYYDYEEEFYFYDIAPQYTYIDPISPTWMSGGASGSMLITEDCEVCGIYWGGMGNNQYFWPYFSLFKTSDYDFTQQWIN